MLLFRPASLLRRWSLITFALGSVFACGENAAPLRPGAAIPQPATNEPVERANNDDTPCSLQALARPTPTLEFLIATANPRIPRGVTRSSWVVFSFDRRDGASNAHIRALTDYRSHQHTVWDTDPAHLYVTGEDKPALGPTPSLPHRYVSVERCGRHVQFEHGGRRIDLHSRCVPGGFAVELCVGSTGTTLFRTREATDLAAVIPWVGHWGDDASQELELLLEIESTDDHRVRYAGIYRIDMNGSAALLGEYLSGVGNDTPTAP